MIKTQISGNLVRDPEFKVVKKATTDDKTVCILTVASNRPGKEAPDILRVEVWGKMADVCAKYLKKGSGIFAAGDLNIDLYQKDDEKRIAVSLVNAQVEFTDRKPRESEEGN